MPRAAGPGIDLVGMPFGMHGLGACMRQKVRALVARGIDVGVIEENYSSLKARVAAPDVASRVVDRPRHRAILLCHNLPAIGLLARRRPDLFRDRHVIGAPYWEFPQLPPSRAEALSHLDEIWVPTRFMADLFSAHTDKPVRRLPVHLSARPRAADGGEGEALVFGYAFDATSLVARKDPAVLLLAFLEAFGTAPRAPVRLILKCKSEASPLVRRRDIDDLAALARLDPRIEFIDRALDDAEMRALADRIDVYVSPHRAEGLSLGLIEMMLRGTPVIATGYSGPAEFLTPDMALPLAHDITPVGRAAIGDIASHFTWAEVRVETLADALATTAGDPAAARGRAETARRHLARRHGAAAFASAVRDRLERIAA